MNSGNRPPWIIAVGGGKGGVGKSVFSILLGQWLARLGRDTVVVDLDLGGANIHTLLGIKEPPGTLHDLLSQQADSLEDICISTQVESLRVICGASEILSVANPVFAQKQKIMRKLFGLKCDLIVLDLGAGASMDMLDFFLLADQQILVTTAEPIAIFNAYAFLRNAVYRRLSQQARRIPELKELVQVAMVPRNDLNLNTVKCLTELVEDIGADEWAHGLRDSLNRIHPYVVVNQVKDARDRQAGRIIQQVADRYLMIPVHELGAVAYDSHVAALVASMTPLTRANGYSAASEAVREIASNLLKSAPPKLVKAASDPAAGVSQRAAAAGE